jgi:F-type H+-transporting ATPase subunit b
LNFAILAVLIVMFSKSKLPAMFRTRTDEIQRGMKEAQKASEDANRRLADIETRLQRLDADVAAMRAAADAEASAEDERIRQAAELEKKKIVEGAESEIAAAAKLARRELKTYVADLAVSLAEKRIHVDADTDRALVGNFVAQLKEPGAPGKDGQ